MKLHFTVYGTPPDEIASIARHAEDLGFDGIWVGDHIVLPIGYTSEAPYPAHKETNVVSETSAHHFDSWLMIGQLIGATSRIWVCSGVTVLPLRHPLAQARAAVTAVEVSKGRFRMGIGSGWLREEFEVLGIPSEDRGEHFDEAVDILNSAFAGGPFEHSGRFYEFGQVQITPVPVDVPLVFGGSRPKALRRAALRGDGWANPTDCDLRACIHARKWIEDWRLEAGRSNRPFSYFIKLVESPTEEVFERYLAAGFDELIVPCARIYPDANSGAPLYDRLVSLEKLASLAQNVAH